MKRYTEGERRRLVLEYEGSPGSATAFCRKRGVSVGSLAEWRRRYRAAGEGTKEGAIRGSWLPVVLETVSTGPSEMHGYVLENAAGSRIKVPERFNIDEVRALWKVIGEQGAREA